MTADPVLDADRQRRLVPPATAETNAGEDDEDREGDEGSALRPDEG
jgi:hypothetical protein